jgi:hypothetical protein
VLDENFIEEEELVEVWVVDEDFTEEELVEV